MYTQNLEANYYFDYEINSVIKQKYESDQYIFERYLRFYYYM